MSRPFSPRRRALLLAPAALAAPRFALSQADGFPDRPITVFCPFTAGGTTDVALRTLADGAAKIFGKRVIVENKPGAGGVIAAQQAAGARPDGYTLALIPTGVFRQPHIAKSGFNPPTDMTWVINIAGYVFGVSVRADAPWNSWKEFVAYAKANPGKISYASPGIGSDLHITMDIIAQKEGIDWVQVPYKGTVEMLTALKSGEVQAYAGTPPWEMIKAGTFRPLITWGEKPTNKVPNLPTLRQVYGFASAAPWGLAGPKDIDPRIVKILHDGFRKAMEEPAFVEAVDRYGMESNYKSSEEYAKYAKATFDAQKLVVERLGLKP
jgi:tripartite-type tricarboxylate transporter receptor subunit TctC